MQEKSEKVENKIFTAQLSFPHTLAPLTNETHLFLSHTCTLTNIAVLADTHWPFTNEPNLQHICIFLN